jgi:hypothetical protein
MKDLGGLKPLIESQEIELAKSQIAPHNKGLAMLFYLFFYQQRHSQPVWQLLPLLQLKQAIICIVS